MQIIKWMESQSSFMASESDQAQKLDLIIKVNGIDKAELYLEQITNRALKKAACLFLLRFYVKKKELEKAEALMEKLGSLGFIVTPHPFNEIMKLYAAKGLFSKVIYVIRHMKLSKVPLNVLSYNLWMDASSKAFDIATVEKIFKEMTGDKNVEVRWNTYCTLANIYTRYGLVDRALAALKIAENKLYVKQRPGYSFVMTIYAALGDRKGVLRLWEANKSAVGRIPCAPYMCVISCLVEVGDILEAESVFETWESQCFKYHIRVPNILIGSYMSNGCVEKAERLFLRALKKGAVPNNKTWEILIEGWVRNKQLDKAAEALKKHFSLGKHCIWRPPPEVLLAIVEYYEKLCYIDEATGFVELLQRMSLMNLHLYKLLVRLHIRARKAIPGILKMMDLDSIVPDEETNSLIQQADDILVLKAA